MTSTREELGNRLRSAREYLELTQQEVAELVGLPRSAVSLVESGERKVDTFELKRFAEAYGRPTADFTGEANREIPEDLEALLRRAGDMTEEDRAEIVKFADWLLARRSNLDSE